jgi:hypothetical protein
MSLKEDRVRDLIFIVVSRLQRIRDDAGVGFRGWCFEFIFSAAVWIGFPFEGVWRTVKLSSVAPAGSVHARLWMVSHKLKCMSPRG